MYAKCRNCEGSGKFYPPKGGGPYPCKACDGSGLNKKFYVTRCSNGYCSTEITYPVGKTAPKYCISCANKDCEKTCAQDGCYNKIHYKLGWDKVSDYCKNCFGKRENGWTPRRCIGQTLGANCGKLIWSPPGKNFTMCQECSQKAQSKKAEQWKVKRCKNCSNEIKYHVDWSKVPDICNNCKELEQAKWKTKHCSGGCGSTIKYHVDWEHPPNFCSSCKEKQKNHGGNSWPADKPLPGSDRSITDLGVSGATIKASRLSDNVGGFHVTIWTGSGSSAERMSWEVDKNGNYKPGSVHYTDKISENLLKKLFGNRW